MQTIIKILNLIITSVEIAIDAFIKVIDKSIIAVQSVSIKIVELFLHVFRLLFYLLPFVLFSFIGFSKDWLIMFYIGVGTLGLVIILFIRDFLVALKENDNTSEQQKTPKAGRVIIIVLILNLISIGYALPYFLFDFSLENSHYDEIQKWIERALK
jgi:hypothetical protein